MLDTEDYIRNMSEAMQQFASYTAVAPDGVAATALETFGEAAARYRRGQDSARMFRQTVRNMCRVMKGATEVRAALHSERERLRS